MGESLISPKEILYGASSRHDPSAKCQVNEFLCVGTKLKPSMPVILYSPSTASSRSSILERRTMALETRYTWHLVSKFPRAPTYFWAFAHYDWHNCSVEERTSDRVLRYLSGRGTEAGGSIIDDSSASLGSFLDGVNGSMAVR